jgi:sn-glycerol 3-phosphate transport system ATP-binding protein/multiple sugar transport system ATP-binding protein
MDEPLTNLDAELRADMRTEIKHLQTQLGATMVYVTHDQVEAMSLGDRIAILNQGRVEQIGTPLEVYDRPASLFCATFIGSPPMNLIEVEVADGALRGPGGLVLSPPPGLPRDRTLVAGIRPEALEVTSPGEQGSIPARVVSAEALGDEIIYVVDHGGERDVRVRMPPTVRYAEDAPVGLRHAGGSTAVYDASTEELVARWRR